MSFWRRRWFRWLTPALAAAALAGPAQARPMLDEELGGGSGRSTSLEQQAPATIRAAEADHAFGWTQVGFSALGGLALVLAAGGGVLVLRNGRQPAGARI